MKKILLAVLILASMPVFELDTMAIVGGSTESGYKGVGAILIDLGASGTATDTGILISNSGRGWLLTSARNVAGISPSKIYIGFDTTITGMSSFYTVTNIYLHPDYNSTTGKNDIALLKLTTTVSGVTPLTYMTDDTRPGTGDTIKYIGYGISCSMCMDQNTRRSASNTISDVSADLIFTNSTTGGPCSGDSGGAGIVNVSGTDYVAGVVSSFNGNCQGLAQSSRVSFFYDFIKDTIAGTGDVSAPKFLSGYPSKRNVTQTAFDMDVQLNEPGTVFYALFPQGSPPPAVNEVISGAGSLQNGSLGISSAVTTGSVSISGVTAGTSYDVYFAAKDDETVPNVQGTATVMNVTTQSSGGANNPPSKPELVSPGNGTDKIAVPVGFAWHASDDVDSDAVHYKLYVSTDASFATSSEYDIAKRDTQAVYLAGLFLAIPLLMFSFKLKKDGMREKTTLLLCGVMVCSLLAGVSLSCKKNSGGSLIGFNNKNITYDVPGLNKSTTYYWKVTAIDEHDAGTESDVWNFTTADE